MAERAGCTLSLDEHTAHCTTARALHSHCMRTACALHAHCTHQMRKIYINKQLVERVKTLKDLLADVGSVHEFPLGDSLPLEGRRIAQLHIVPKGFCGFTYQASRAMVQTARSPARLEAPVRPP